MYFNKTVLTLMAISLYLIPRAVLAEPAKEGTSEVEQQSKDAKSLDQTQSANEIIEFQEDNVDLKKILKDARENNQLCVVYCVLNNGNYDEMFQELARKHSATKFVKINMNARTVEEETTTPQRNLETYFYKFGEYAGNCLSEVQQDIDDQIKNLEKLTEQQLKSLYVDEYEAEGETDIEVEQVDGIYLPKDENEIDSLYYSKTKNNEKYCLTYAVKNTDAFDQLFKDLAKEHSNTKFIKINTHTFKTRKNERLQIEFQPLMVVQNRNFVTEAFSFTEKAKIEERLTYYENMSDAQFEKVVKEENLRKVIKPFEYVDGVYEATEENKLSYIYDNLYEADKYSLTYYVNDTEDFDQMFKELAKEHTETIFIRINTHVFTLNNGEKPTIENQPFIVIKRYDFLLEEFTSNEKEKIEGKLNHYENLTEDQFDQLVEEERKKRYENQGEASEEDDDNDDEVVGEDNEDYTKDDKDD